MAITGSTAPPAYHFPTDAKEDAMPAFMKLDGIDSVGGDRSV